MQMLLEMGFIVHPAHAFRVLVPFDTSTENIIMELCQLMTHHLVANSNYIVDLTNRRYLKNRSNTTAAVSDEAADIFKVFPMLTFEEVKNTYGRPTTDS
jgi:hypothetical protein